VTGKHDARDALTVYVSRGDLVESVHRVAACAVDARGVREGGRKKRRAKRMKDQDKV